MTAAQRLDPSGAGRRWPHEMEPLPPARPSGPDPIVAVGLLTQRDVEVLGVGFRRLFPVGDATGFDELLAQLDAVAADERTR